MEDLVQLEIETGWASGFFEGEGTAFVQSRLDRADRARMSISSSDLDSLIRFKSWADCGAIYEKPANTLSKKQLYAWECAAAGDVRRLALRMLPHVGARRMKSLIGILILVPVLPAHRVRNPTGQFVKAAK